MALILYVGEDMNFFTDLFEDLSQLQKEGDKAFSLERRPIPSGPFPLLFKEIWSLRPVAVLLDFASYASKNDPRAQYLMGVMKLLRQNHATKPILTLAIHDYLQSKVLVEQLLLAGMRFNYIKSAENDLIAHEIQTIACIKGLETAPLALALDNRECQLIQDLRVSYATNEFLRVETNVELPLGKILHLHQHPFTTLESSYLSVKVAPASEGAIYFSYKHSYQLYYHAPDTEKPLKKDITFLGPSPKPRQTRVLIIDPLLEFIDEKLPHFDQLNFSLNIQSDLELSTKALERFKPHILAVQNVASNEVELLRRKLHPKASLLQFKTEQRGPLCTHEPLTFSLVEDLARTYEQKVSVDLSGKFFFSSQHPGVIAKVAHPITLKAFNESLVYFESKLPFPEFCVLEMQAPFKTLLTTIPPLKEVKESLKNYQVAITNYTDETQTRLIRQRLNAFFTKEAELQRMKDKEELAKANTRFLEAQEAAAKAKKQDNKKE